jgi:F-type H+-transporting ATPase subunit gamma
MSQIAPLRNKIRAIQTTKKITHAVRLVSMSSFSKLEKESICMNYYTDNLTKAFVTLLAQVPDWKHRALFPEDLLDSNPLIILISSSKGLCGSFNSQTPSFIAIGKKAVKFLDEKKFGNILCRYPELTHVNFTTIAQELTDLICEGKQIHSSVLFYSNHLKNFFIQAPVKQTLIPLSLQEAEKSYIDFEWEQDKKEILNYMALRYIKSSILNLLFQSLISESAARFLTMDKATTNAEEYLEDLTLQYNKSRQALITREVSELSANF